MVVGSRGDGGAQVYKVSAKIQATINSIREIVGGHSDSEILAVLRETNMDPNETAQRLLNQDPFHEVKRRRDKKKEPQNTGSKVPTEPKRPVDHPVQWMKSNTLWDRNARRGTFVKNASPGINREFRVVRDNRVNQNSNRDVKPEMPQHSVSGNEQVGTSLPEKSFCGTLYNDKHSTTRTEGKLSSQSFTGPSKTDDLGKVADMSGSHRRATLESGVAITKPSFQTQKGAVAVSSSSSGMYASSSDPVHVPSPDSRLAGSVGAFRREVGVVGGRRQSTERPSSHSSFSNNSFSLPALGKDISTATESVGQPKGSQPNQTLASEPFIPVSRPFSSHQYNSKMHQQSLGHQKASQPNMEWRPKSSQKSKIANSGGETEPASPHADNSAPSKVDVAALSDELSEVNIFDSKHVIIPQHLRVPEAERAGLTFGSFGSGFDSAKGFTSAFQTYADVEATGNELSVSTPVFPIGTSEDLSLGDQGDLADGQARTSRSGSPGSAAQSDQPHPENHDSSSPHDAENFADIGLVQSHSPSYDTSEQQQMQNPPSLPTFSEAYDPQPSYDMPFFGSAMEDNVHGQRLASPSEALGSHVANSSPASTMATMVQQQTLAQQQPVLYPQVHISHFPNFVPYRQFLSPLYVPPMPMPNYSSNPAYPHPSSGSSYLLMPGGSSHLTAGGMKYATSQYKPGNPTPYGNYTNPAGYAINAPGTVGGASGLEDVSRIKYKDNSLYVPNPQAEASEIWIQTPRDLPNMHSAAPFYNLSGQAPHAAYMPTPTGHASFNAAAQSSHVQFPGLYHPPQQATMANPHHLVHQQVPPAVGGNVGVGVAAPAPQVGSYQQPQVGHLNWTGNF